MKAILQFEIPEEKDEFTLATRGCDMWVTLFEFDQWLRSQIKYNDRIEYQEIRNKLYELLDTYNISFDMVS